MTPFNPTTTDYKPAALRALDLDETTLRQGLNDCHNALARLRYATGDDGGHAAHLRRMKDRLRRELNRKGWSGSLAGDRPARIRPAPPSQAWREHYAARAIDPATCGQGLQVSSEMRALLDRTGRAGRQDPGERPDPTQCQNDDARYAGSPQ